jgi:catechol 2,3-dioxygenase-like lactoylglutathione lyase family enzyme
LAAVSHIRVFDHVAITVDDLDSVTAFFVGLGLEVEGRTFVEGEFLDPVIGIPDSRTEIVMLRPPEGGTGIELSSFVGPDHEPGTPRGGLRISRLAQGEDDEVFNPALSLRMRDSGIEMPQN